MKETFREGVLGIDFPGDLLGAEIGELLPILEKILDSYPQANSLEADISNCHIIDSKGINLLIALFREAQNRHLAFRVKNPSPEVHRLLTLMNLADLFNLQSPSHE